MSNRSTALRAATEAFDAESRLAHADWAALSAALDSQGCAVIEQMLTPDECRALAALYPQDHHFRSHIYICLLYTSPSPRDS